jgi:hypothetical protein
MEATAVNFFSMIGQPIVLVARAESFPEGFTSAIGKGAATYTEEGKEEASTQHCRS